MVIVIVVVRVDNQSDPLPSFIYIDLIVQVEYRLGQQLLFEKTIEIPQD